MHEVFNSAVQTAQDEAELLLLLRQQEWTQDLHRFGYECLGNSPETDKKLGFNDEPRVREYTNWAGKKILEWLRDRHAGKVKSRRKIMILVPRECGKTTNLTTTLPVWLQLHDPNIAITVDMARFKGMADKTLDVIKEHMYGSRPTSKLIETFGEFYNTRRTWNDKGLVSARRTDMARRDKTVEITSVDVGSTGSHPDVWIWDDPVTRELAGPTWYATCWDHYLGTFPIIRSDGIFILVATRYGDDDPAGRIISEEIAPAVVAKYGDLPSDFRYTWPEYAHLAGWDVWLDHGRNPNNPDEAWYPTIWTPERMEEFERISPGEFAAQVMNMPGQRADQPLKQEHVDRCWVDFHDVPEDVWNNIYIHMDIAWKDSKQFKAATGDYNCIQVWGRDNAGHSYYLPIAYRGRDMQDGWRRNFVQVLQQVYRKADRIRLLTYDMPTGGMGDSISNFIRDVCLQEGLPCPPIKEMNRRSQDVKDDRAILASRYWIDGTVRLVKHAPHVNVLVDEMLGIGSTRYDDMRDAAADHFHSDIWRGGLNRRTKGFQPGLREANKPWMSYFDGDRDDDAIIIGPSGQPRTPLEIGINQQGYYGR